MEKHTRLGQTIALAYMATFEPSQGWSLVLATTTLNEHGASSDRIRFQGLTNAELIDVIEATAYTRL